MPPGTRSDIRHMDAAGRLSWRAAALNAYTICAFIRSFENTVLKVANEKNQLLPMPSFEELFEPEPKAATAPDSGRLAGLDELERQMGWSPPGTGESDAASDAGD